MFGLILSHFFFMHGHLFSLLYGKSILTQKLITIIFMIIYLQLVVVLEGNAGRLSSSTKFSDIYAYLPTFFKFHRLILTHPLQ